MKLGLTVSPGPMNENSMVEGNWPDRAGEKGVAACSDSAAALGGTANHAEISAVIWFFAEMGCM